MNKTLTTAQSELLEKIRNEFSFYSKELVERELPEDCNYWWVELTRKNQVEIKADSRTLKALEEAGYIKIIEHKKYTSFNLDIVEVL